MTVWDYRGLDPPVYPGGGSACEGSDDQATAIRNDTAEVACGAIRHPGAAWTDALIMRKHLSVTPRTSLPKAKNWRGYFSRWGDESGVAAVEFAVIAPIGIALLAGIIQFGFALFIESHMAGVARDTARRFAVGASDQSEAVQFAQDSLLNWGVTYTVTVTPPDPSDPSDVDVNVLISLPRSSVAIIDMAGLFQSGTLTTSVTMLTE